ncbi:MAG: transcriptional regulator NrdR [Alphaproteobacteria bacterium]|nr:transcriptional regulator NrdR [Alphaproteobacteria bacterium]
MRCPFCGFEDTQVKDSRPSEDNAAIRRRRSCPECDARFTTFERVQLRELIVIKSDGTKKPFDRDKLAHSMRIALRKRPVDEDKLEQVINGLVRQMETTSDGELSTKEIGELVMETLRRLDHVAYVRYASVYRDFRTPADFNEFVETLKHDAPLG